jgi:hypothetical protein
MDTCGIIPEIMISGRRANRLGGNPPALSLSSPQISKFSRD